MRGRRGLTGVLAAALAASLLVDGCGSGNATQTGGPGPTPSSAPTASPFATPTASVGSGETAAVTPSLVATPAATAAATPTISVAGFYLRAWSVAPVGPENTFGNVPRVISGGKLYSVTYPPFSDSYPLYVQPTTRTISPTGLATVVAEAQADGLLGKTTTFVCPHSADAGMIAGSSTDHLVLIVGGVTHEMTSSCPYVVPTPGPGKPAPGTWAAFQRFKNLLSDPTAWLGSAVGPSTPYTASQLAVLLELQVFAGESPNPSEPTPPDVTIWPLGTPMASFGADLGGDRCGIASGADAAALLPVVKNALATTVFRDGSGTLADVIVRAFLPGEPDPCLGG